MKLCSIINKVVCFFSIIFYNLAAYASNPSTKQEVARRLLIPTSQENTAPTDAGSALGGLFDFGKGFIQLIKTLAIFGGIALVIFSIQLYVKHRKDPIENPLSTVVMLFFVGLALIVLSFIPIKV